MKALSAGSAQHLPLFRVPPSLDAENVAPLVGCCHLLFFVPPGETAPGLCVAAPLPLCWQHHHPGGSARLLVQAWPPRPAPTTALRSASSLVARSSSLGCWHALVRWVSAKYDGHGSLYHVAHGSLCPAARSYLCPVAAGYLYPVADAPGSSGHLVESVVPCD